jgi:hypothetical protein
MDSTLYAQLLRQRLVFSTFRTIAHDHKSGCAVGRSEYLKGSQKNINSLSADERRYLAKHERIRGKPQPHPPLQISLTYRLESIRIYSVVNHLYLTMESLFPGQMCLYSLADCNHPIRSMQAIEQDVAPIVRRMDVTNNRKSHYFADEITLLTSAPTITIEKLNAPLLDKGNELATGFGPPYHMKLSFCTFDHDLR